MKASTIYWDSNLYSVFMHFFPFIYHSNLFIIALLKEELSGKNQNKLPKHNSQQAKNQSCFLKKVIKKFMFKDSIGGRKRDKWL